MGRFRMVAAAAVLAVAMVAGAACTGPPPTAEDVGEALGDGIGWVLTIAILNFACAITPGCESPICMLAPCSPIPSTAPAAPLTDSVAAT